jgi:quercetin dioxygenase-like cupin family protein
MAQAEASVIVDSERVRVTSWTFQPGQATGMHRHELDYVVVPVSGGSFTVTGPDGARSELRQEAGQAYARQAGVEHDVANAGPRAAVFVEVELKELG